MASKETVLTGTPVAGDAPLPEYPSLMLDVAAAATNPAAWREEMNRGGFKADAHKPPIHLIYPKAIELEAAVFGFGAQKYAAYNWCKGMAYTRLISAAQRHLLAITAGEDTDPESGLPHAAHVRCCMAMLIGMMDLHPEQDDRYGKN